ncbi:MAG: hypothetical protein PT947_01895 [Suipraeoptans intestinalis]|nr:hypothetical protein [Suipraeoptans intestinalis]
MNDWRSGVISASLFYARGRFIKNFRGTRKNPTSNNIKKCEKYQIIVEKEKRV